MTEHCMCDYCKDGALHASDCSVHNEPALPIGPCDCHLSKAVAWQEPGNPRHIISTEDKRNFTRPKVNGPVTLAMALRCTIPLYTLEAAALAVLPGDSQIERKG